MNMALEQAQSEYSKITIRDCQATVQALTDALTELQRDFRDKSQECHILRETVDALSSELRVSDGRLETSELRTEQLEFNLQSLTFCERNDSCPLALALGEDDSTETRIGSRKEKKQLPSVAESDIDSSENGHKKRSKHSKKSKSEHKSKESKKKDKKYKPKKLSKESPPTPPPPVDCRDDRDSQSESEQVNKSPRQAAFRRVMRERDMAQTQANRLNELLEQSREQCQYLNEQLHRTTALAELAYQDDSRADPSLQQTDQMLRQVAGDGATQGLRWLTKGQPLNFDSYKPHEEEKSRGGRVNLSQVGSGQSRASRLVTRRNCHV
jgi:hypothetical protein